MCRRRSACYSRGCLSQSSQLGSRKSDSFAASRPANPLARGRRICFRRSRSPPRPHVRRPHSGPASLWSRPQRRVVESRRLFTHAAARVPQDPLAISSFCFAELLHHSSHERTDHTGSSATASLFSGNASRLSRRPHGRRTFPLRLRQPPCVRLRLHARLLLTCRSKNSGYILQLLIFVISRQVPVHILPQQVVRRGKPNLRWRAAADANLFLLPHPRFQFRDENRRHVH